MNQQILIFVVSLLVAWGIKTWLDKKKQTDEFGKPAKGNKMFHLFPDARINAIVVQAANYLNDNADLCPEFQDVHSIRYSDKPHNSHPDALMYIHIPPNAIVVTPKFVARMKANHKLGWKEAATFLLHEAIHPATDHVGHNDAFDDLYEYRAKQLGLDFGYEW